MKQIQNIIVIGILLFVSGVVAADTLLIQTVENNKLVDRPVRGVSKAQVENEYGSPVKKYAPVGKPPITKWAYANITVYFEYDHVIHAVVNRKK